MSVTVTLTQTSGGSAVEAITASVVYGTDYFFRRLNQFSIRTCDAGTVTYDIGPTEVHGVLVMKNVSYAHGYGLRDWIENNIVFQKYKFKIAALTNIDLGLGKNTEISTSGGATEDCYFDGGQSTEGLFEYTAPGLYNVRFPYRFIL